MTYMTLLLLVFVTFISRSKAEKESRNPNVGLSPKQLIRKYGYPVEVHSIITGDGYIMETYRIPHGKNNVHNKSKCPVLLVPGLLSSSGVFLLLGTVSLGFVLADKGYDVWLANYRGTTWSRKHKTLDPVRNSSQFFDFSFQEIGLYDIPANIDYILKLTNHLKLFYIGHSQGTTSFFAMAAAKPKYNEKVILMIGLAPVMYISNVQYVPFSILSQNVRELEKLVIKHNQYELLRHSPLYFSLAQTLCNDYAPTQFVCALLTYFLAGYSPNLNKTVIPVAINHFPAGTTSKNIFHIVQLLKSKTFQMYDFGETENRRRYGQITPPKFDTSKITSPVALYYGTYDILATIQDVELISSALPNLVKKKEIDGYSHTDFLVGTNVIPALYDDIIDTMKQYTQ